MDVKISAVVAALAFGGHALAGDYHVVSVTRDGLIAIDPDRRSWEHPGHVDTPAQLILPQPHPYYGLMIQRVEVTNEWRCKTRLHRVSMRSLYSDTGRYVRSERAAEPWVTVDPDSDLSEMLDFACSRRPFQSVQRFRDIATLQKAYLTSLKGERVRRGTTPLLERALGDQPWRR